MGISTEKVSTDLVESMEESIREFDHLVKVGNLPQALDAARAGLAKGLEASVAARISVYDEGATGGKSAVYSIEGEVDNASYYIERHERCTKHFRKCKCPGQYVTLVKGLREYDVAVLIQSAGMALAGQSYLYG